MMHFHRMSAPAVIRDVLGRERAVQRTWPDGSWECPFCYNAVIAERGEAACRNPGCCANPDMPIAAAQKLVDTAARAERERTEREKLAEWRREAREQEARERSAAWAEISAECERRGACVHCAHEHFRSYRPPRYVRHRKGCPKMHRTRT